MIEVPMVHDVLVVPDDLSRVCIQGECRIVIQMFVVIPAQNEFRRRYRHRSSDIDKIQLGVIAWNHPSTDVPALFHRDAAPSLIAWLSRFRNSARPPKLLSSFRVVSGNNAAFVTRSRLTLPA